MALHYVTLHFITLPCITLHYITMRKDVGVPVVRPLATRAKDPELDSQMAQHVQILFSWAFTYGAVGSLVLSWFLDPTTWVHFLPVPLCNNLV